jgi:hypothetical protein
MNTQRPASSWHMHVAMIYLVIAGLWAWVGLWRELILEKAPLSFAYLGVYCCVMLVAVACFAAAYAMYRRSKFAVPLIAIVPIAQWIAFAILIPEHAGVTDVAVDYAYIRQLPPMLKIDIAFYVALTLYALFLWRRGRLS